MLWNRWRNKSCFVVALISNAGWKRFYSPDSIELRSGKFPDVHLNRFIAANDKPLCRSHREKWIQCWNEQASICESKTETKTPTEKKKKHPKNYHSLEYTHFYRMQPVAKSVRLYTCLICVRWSAMNLANSLEAQPASIRYTHNVWYPIISCA